MRMRKKKNRDARFENCRELAVLNPAAAKGGWKDVFGNQAPIYLEIGCGKGAFITQMAEKYPYINFVAVERCLDVLILAMEKAKALSLANLKFIDGDAGLLCDFFEKGEVARIYLNFSDPWPKRGHAKRRLTHRSYLEKYRNVLPEGGELHLKTDNRGLFDFSLSEFQDFGLTVKDITYDLHSSGLEGNIMTEYEKNFSEKGMPIHRCVCIF